MSYKEIVLASRPKAEIVPSENFKTVTKNIPTEADLKDGQVVVQALYLSLDPAMRGWMRDARSYIPPVQIDEKMRGAGIGRIHASKSPRFSKGDIVTSGGIGWVEYAILNAAPEAKEVEKTEIPSNGRTTDALGVLGLTGLTAYFGLLDIGQPQKGETVVVSGAAGATGSVVCQIAKIKGARVVGIAGSADKVAWLKELGCDEALDYKAADFKERFKEATPNFIDVFFDNVGGEILDLAFTRAVKGARFVMCGAISQYNAAEAKGPKNYTMIIAMRIKMQGFIVFDYAQRYSEARKEIAGWLAEGKLQRKETIIKGGLEKAGQGLVDLYKGINTGKLLVEVSPEGESAKL